MLNRRHQVIPWTNVDILSVRARGIHPRGTHFSQESIQSTWKVNVIHDAITSKETVQARRETNKFRCRIALTWQYLGQADCYIPAHTSLHYNDVIMNVMASQITSLTIVNSTVYSRRRPTKRSKLRWPVNYSHKVPVTRKMFPFDDVIMNLLLTKSL